MARTAAELGVDCDLERAPAFTYVESRDRLEAIRSEAEAARDAGLQASLSYRRPCRSRSPAP